MLQTLKDLFESLQPPRAGDSQAHTEHALQLAAAVLLVEVMRADASLDVAESEAALSALQAKFTLSRDEGERLMELAHRASRESTDHYTFTSRINQAFNMEQKVRMVEMMWRVAYADGTLAAHENHLMRKMADLLHVPHGAYVHAKMRAIEGAGSNA